MASVFSVEAKTMSIMYTLCLPASVEAPDLHHLILSLQRSNYQNFPNQEVAGKYNKAPPDSLLWMVAHRTRAGATERVMRSGESIPALSRGEAQTTRKLSLGETRWPAACQPEEADRMLTQRKWPFCCL